MQYVSRFTSHERGLTLIELLIAVSILVIMAGTAYTAFQASLDVYHKSESRIVMNQKCRMALDRIATDLANLQAVQGDDSLALISQDNPDEGAGERDVISFVTLVQTDPDPFLAQLNSEAQRTLTDEENQQTLLSDVQRVVYYIGEDPSQQDPDSERRGALATEGGEETQNLALLRIATTSLNPETVILPLLESGTVPTADEEGNPIYVDIVPIIDQIVSFDVKYSDGEEWYESWENTQTIPRSVQVILTVAAENGKRNPNGTPDTLTQSTMVYLMMSANFSEQQPGATPGGN
jgi:prepilin-type N-terminal cleavage/methylation domain-containing protein